MRTVTQKLDKFLHHLFMSQRRFIRSGFLFLLHEMIEPLLNREHLQFFAADALQHVAQEIARAACC
jgi:hypothetical protein